MSKRCVTLDEFCALEPAAAAIARSSFQCITTTRRNTAGEVEVPEDCLGLACSIMSAEARLMDRDGKIWSEPSRRDEYVAEVASILSDESSTEYLQRRQGDARAAPSKESPTCGFLEPARVNGGPVAQFSTGPLSPSVSNT
jgi:hypothetical protein